MHFTAAGRCMSHTDLLYVCGKEKMFMQLFLSEKKKNWRNEIKQYILSTAGQ